MTPPETRTSIFELCFWSPGAVVLIKDCLWTSSHACNFRSPAPSASMGFSVLTSQAAREKNADQVKLVGGRYYLVEGPFKSSWHLQIKSCWLYDNFHILINASPARRSVPASCPKAAATCSTWRSQIRTQTRSPSKSSTWEVITSQCRICPISDHNWRYASSSISQIK